MRRFIPNRLKKILIVLVLYSLHLVAIYTTITFMFTDHLILKILFVTSVVCLCLSVIVGWLIAADDFREAFIVYKKRNEDRDPSSEFTIFAPIRFVVAVLLWPYLVAFGEENREDRE